MLWGGGGGNVIRFMVTETIEPCPGDPSDTHTIYTYSHTWQQIHDAVESGAIVYIVQMGEGGGIFSLSTIYLLNSVFTNNSDAWALDFGDLIADYSDPNSLTYESGCDK